MRNVIVVALGGNAVKKAEEKGTADEQFRNVRETCKQIVQIIKRGYQLVITHGNGPQAGNLLIQQEEGWRKLVPPQPLEIVGAMTQGQVGYMLQQSLMNYLKESKLNISVVTVLTQVLVAKDDPSFQTPSKPIGPFYTKLEAERLKKKKGYVVERVRPTGKKAYRRVVPSPNPKAILGKAIIKRLVNAGVVVIASGGGGIPVIMTENGSLKGVEAVIDKDLAGERLAQIVGAKIFLILTDVEKVKLNYGKPDEKDLDKMTLPEAKRYHKDGHFLRGSMEPKVVACIRFLESGGKEAIITSLNKAIEALDGKTGTRISRVHER